MGAKGSVEAEAASSSSLWTGAESTFKSSHGDTIGYRTWLPSGTPTGVVFIVHGLHEHGGRFSAVADLLTKKGFAVYAADHVGHGLSAGAEMGFVSDHNLMTDALVQFITTVLADQPHDLPVYLLCHSMGVLVGAVALAKMQPEHEAVAARIKAAVWTGCPLQPGPGSASPLGLRCCFCLTKSKGLLNCLAGCFASADPHGPNAPIDVRALSHDPEVLARAKKDPMHFMGRIKNKTAHEVIKLSTQTRQVLPSITIPSLLMHGGDDDICYSSGSEEMLGLLGSANKELKVIPGLLHEILNEPNFNLLVDDIVAFYGGMDSIVLEESSAAVQ